MSMPYTYNGSIKPDKQDDFDPEQFEFNLIEQARKNQTISKLNKNSHTIHFSQSSFFWIDYNIEITVNQSIDYEIKLNRLIQVSIALVLFIAFFSSFGFVGFLWFSAIFTLLFFALNLVIVDKNVRDLIHMAMKDSGLQYENAEMLSKEQMQWIKDKSRCPACGEAITDYDRNCPECGLRLREKAPDTPYDVSRFSEKRLQYHFRKKKNDD